MQQRKPVRDMFIDVFLYDNQSEQLLKCLIWIGCWVGGALNIWSATFDSSVASAFFVFSISQMMEFFPKKDKKYTICRVINTIFIIDITVVIITSLIVLLCGNYNGLLQNIMNWCSLLSAIYIGVNFVSALFIGPYIKPSIDPPFNNDPTNSSQTDSFDPSSARKVFIQNYQMGALGNLKNNNQQNQEGKENV